MSIYTIKKIVFVFWQPEVTLLATIYFTCLIAKYSTMPGLNAGYKVVQSHAVTSLLKSQATFAARSPCDV